MKKSDSNEWISRVEGKENVVRVGLTTEAASQLSEVVFVKLPNVGQKTDVSEEIVILESVKAAVEVYAPLKGTVVAVNERLLAQPDLVTKSSHSDGWLYELKLDDEADYHSLFL